MKRDERAKRKAVDKSIPNGRCIRQEYYTDADGIERVKYLHVGRGWKTRRV